MSHAASHPVKCADPSCSAWHPSGKWGNIRAADAGWFHAKDGTAYCPKHIPKWVRKWRAR